MPPGGSLKFISQEVPLERANRVHPGFHDRPRAVGVCKEMDQGRFRGTSRIPRCAFDIHSEVREWSRASEPNMVQSQRLTLHCGTGVLGCHREASSAGALQSDPFSSRAARKISLERKSHTSRLQTMVGYVATARNSVPASILYLLLSKNSLRFARSLHPTPRLYFVWRRLIGKKPVGSNFLQPPGGVKI